MKKPFVCLMAIGFGILLTSQTGWAKDCLKDPTEYAARLETCKMMYSCIFVHPFSGEKLNKHILGMEGGKCKTQEEMPNNGKMTCLFSEKQRKEVAAYLKQSAKAGQIETKTKTDLGSGQTTQTEKQDGKVVKNPLQAALQAGTCVVSGYGTPEPSQLKMAGGCQDDTECTQDCRGCKRGKQICMQFEKESKCLECTSSWMDCKEGYQCNEETHQCVKE